MLDFVREAFEIEKQKQKDLGIHCEVTIDGYTDFIFINRFGQAQHQATLNKAKEKQELENSIFQTAGIAQKYNCMLLCFL
ncbi:Uncharacterised protein [uncultured Clostridium sp.]|nr:hypothetical protein [Mediterraneibacter massiliensis]SCH62441.1 Uncharacterised protein [uncultured Clostridium sp.]